MAKKLQCAHIHTYSGCISYLQGRTWDEKLDFPQNLEKNVQNTITTFVHFRLSSVEQRKRLMMIRQTTPLEIWANRYIVWVILFGYHSHPFLSIGNKSTNYAIRSMREQIYHLSDPGPSLSPPISLTVCAKKGLCTNLGWCSRDNMDISNQ